MSMVQSVFYADISTHIHFTIITCHYGHCDDYLKSPTTDKQNVRWNDKKITRD